MAWLKPETKAVRPALRGVAPVLADGSIEFLAEGWEFWAFEAGDHVLRFPKNEASVNSLRTDRALLPELQPHLSTAVPHIDVWSDDGPNGAPFAGHAKLPGRPLRFEPSLEAAGWPLDLPRPAGFGRDLGRLLRQLHAFPAERALALGVPMHDATVVRGQRIEHFEQVIRRVFPLVSCEARRHIESMYLRAINDATFYDFEPRLTHRDLDSNTLVDERGEISGLIDFGAAVVGSVAIDYWLPLFGFARLGIAGQTAACIEASGIDNAALDRLRPELEFLDFRYPLLDILYGLDSGIGDYVTGGIRALNASLPRDLRCE